MWYTKPLLKGKCLCFDLEFFTIAIVGLEMVFLIRYQWPNWKAKDHVTGTMDVINTITIVFGFILLNGVKKVMYKLRVQWCLNSKIKSSFFDQKNVYAVMSWLIFTTIRVFILLILLMLGLTMPTTMSENYSDITQMDVNDVNEIIGSSMGNNQKHYRIAFC